jgi:hypothetical protein
LSIITPRQRITADRSTTSIPAEGFCRVQLAALTNARE